MFGQTWYNHSIKNYIYLFGTLFQDISIQRTDVNGAAITGQLIKVPIEFAQKLKWLTRLTQDPKAGAVDPLGSGNTQANVEIVVPRMAFELKTLRYDKDRKLTSIGKNVALKAGTVLEENWTFNPVPYTLPFELHVAAKNIEDIFQVIEQILPFFTPNFTVTLEEDFAPFSKDIFVTLTGGPEISDEPFGDFSETKLLTATISFDVLGYLYGPPQTAKIIRTANMRYRVQQGSVVPGNTPTNGGIEQIIFTNPPNLSPDVEPTDFTETWQDL